MWAFASSNLKRALNFWKELSLWCFLIQRDLDTIDPFLLTKDHHNEHPLWFFSEMHTGSYSSHLIPKSLRSCQPMQTAVITEQGSQEPGRGLCPSVLWQVLVLCLRKGFGEVREGAEKVGLQKQLKTMAVHLSPEAFQHFHNSKPVLAYCYYNKTSKIVKL